MFRRFGPRFIGVHITRSGDGMTFEHWQVKNGNVRVYTVSRTQLFDILHGAFHADQVRIADSPPARLAYGSARTISQPNAIRSGSIC
jgi:hypothetical protein